MLATVSAMLEDPPMISVEYFTSHMLYIDGSNSEHCLLMEDVNCAIERF